MTAINISFSEGSNKISIEEGAFNKQTSLTLIGKNTANYAVPIAENFLHLLENFSSRTPPANPVAGQLWFDNTPTVKSLKVYSGTAWNPAGAVKKATTTPDATTSIVGDLWVNPATRQLFMYSGSQWDLIGPQFSSGNQTGPLVEILTDINEEQHSVLTIYTNGIRVAIICAEQFIPKIYMLGFTTLKKGINLSTDNVLGEDNKLWGTADSASALMWDTEYVESTNFLRGDIVSTSTASLNIKDNDGITVGGELAFKISTTSDNSVNLTSKKNTSISFNFYDTSQGNAVTGLYLDPTFKVGIGENNYNPSEALDVLGNAMISGTVTITDVTASTEDNVGSIATYGGISVAKSSRFLSTSLFQDTITLDKDTGGAVLVPNYTSAPAEASLYTIPLQSFASLDIGTASRKFRNVYAESFNGTFSGIHNGTLTGEVVGPAQSLKTDRNFTMTGDMTCEPVPFNGTAAVIMNTVISPNFISSKTKATSSLDTDQILTFRASTGVQRTSKSLFLQSVPAVPVGAIFPFAGIAVPNGYLLCDGSEIPVATYGELFTAIRYSYRVQASLVGVGTFAIPDLRGRFPLGRDNMDNELTVTKSSGISTNAGGNRNGSDVLPTFPANRVHGVSASSLGGTSGSEAIGSPAVNGASGSNVTLNSTGQINSIMNPFQTINYIIFTGVLS
jgi:microcystin-dependent protein